MSGDTKSKIEKYIQVARYAHNRDAEIDEIAEKLYDVFDKGNKLLIFGNGGSAADAQHIAGELVSKIKKERKALSAIALTTNTSLITAIGNDYGFDSIFSRQVEAHAREGDVLWGISTSGNSANILKAFEKGKGLGTFNFSLTGNEGGKLKRLSDFNINIPTLNTPMIQGAHQLIYHVICEKIENKLEERV